MLELSVQYRNKFGKMQTLRKQGLLPAVIYGKKQESTPISIPEKEFAKVWKKAGESTVVTLKTEDGKTYDSLIHDVDFDPVSGFPRHADFYVFEKDHKLKVDVPIEFVGISPGVKDLGGLLVKVMHEVKIEAMPKDLPHAIEADISALTEFGSQILAKDLKLPTGVELAENPEEVIALVAEPKEEIEEAPATIDLDSIEVEKKGKEAAPEEVPSEGEAK